MKKLIIDLAYDLNCTDCSLRLRNRSEVILEATIPTDGQQEFAKDYSEDVKMVDRRLREQFSVAPEYEVSRKMNTMTARWRVLGPVSAPV
jgi:hypothetical protein